jgi:hypothetical protein
VWLKSHRKPDFPNTVTLGLKTMRESSNDDRIPDLLAGLVLVADHGNRDSACAIQSRQL